LLFNAVMACALLHDPVYHAGVVAGAIVERWQVTQKLRNFRFGARSPMIVLGRKTDQ
jgi:hypothetical protein